MDLTAFSLVQPWAGLLMAGVKRYEGRRWAPEPGLYFVHSSLGKTSGLRELRAHDRYQRAIAQAEMTDESAWPQKAILGLVEVTAVLTEETLPDECTLLDLCLCGEVEDAHIWQFGRRWMFPVPVPCDGARRLWQPPAELFTALNEQLAAAGAPVRIGPDSPANYDPPSTGESAGVPEPPNPAAPLRIARRVTPGAVGGSKDAIRFDPDIRAVSVRQPWASLLMAGVKKYEVRPWTSPRPDICLIHASAGKASGIRELRAEEWFQTALQMAGMEDEDGWPQSAIVGLAEFTQIITPDDDLPEDFTEFDADLCGSTEDVFLWRTGRLWPFPQPVPCDGKLNQWRVPADLYPAVNEQLTAIGAPIRAGSEPE